MAVFVIIVVGLLQILGGVTVTFQAASAIHEILGAISFGLGILSVAAGLLLKEVRAIRNAADSWPRSA